jgi:hypothetical protein
MNIMNRFSSALLATLLLAGSAHAQEWRKHVERAQERKESRQDKRVLLDDPRHVAWLEDVLARFDAAWKANDEEAMSAVEGRLRALITAELAEGEAELAAGKPGAAADDRRDDKRDTRVEAATHQTRKKISRELSILRGSRWPADMQRSRALIVELIQLAKQEVGQTRQELREDKRETREDKRETREDKRETREDKRRN